MNERQIKSLVIIGGGFGGLNAAKHLANRKNINVTLIDRHNYHLFQPLLYQVATAGLSPADIAAPIRSILSKAKNIQVVLGEVKKVNLDRQTITTDFADLSFDYCLLACGATSSYFGHEEWEPFAPSLKSLEQATEIRRRVLLAFEKAERELDPEKQRDLQTFIVVGGGPTGVELAGALGEISRFSLNRDFRHIDPKRTRVILIEAGLRVLPSFSSDLSEKAAISLERLGVTVWTQRRVAKITDEGVGFVGGEFIKASTVLWAAGVRPSPLNQSLGVPLSPQGRVIVEGDLSIPGHPNVFCIGDQAHCLDKAGRPLPGLAPVAIQQGQFIAKLIKAEINGEKRPSFEYFDKGQMATIGRTKAVVEFGKFRITGFIAWYVWLGVHIYYLIGFKNKIFVFFQWAWSYLTFKRGARLIVEHNN